MGLKRNKATGAHYLRQQMTSALSEQGFFVLLLFYQSLICTILYGRVLSCIGSNVSGVKLFEQERSQESELT